MRLLDAEATVVPAVVGGGADGRGGGAGPRAGRLAAHLGRQPQLHQHVLQSIQQVTHAHSPDNSRYDTGTGEHTSASLNN